MEAAKVYASLTISSLISAGANINHQDDYGETALIRAVDREMSLNVIALLQAGADATLKDVDGLTALDRAIRYELQIGEDVMEQLEALTRDQ